MFSDSKSFAKRRFSRNHKCGMTKSAVNVVIIGPFALVEDGCGAIPETAWRSIRSFTEAIDHVLLWANKNYFRFIASWTACNPSLAPDAVFRHGLNPVGVRSFQP
jgi:hypothetical protein